MGGCRGRGASVGVDGGETGVGVEDGGMMGVEWGRGCGIGCESIQGGEGRFWVCFPLI